MITEFWYAAGLAERPTPKGNSPEKVRNRGPKVISDWVNPDANANWKFRYYKRILSRGKYDIGEWFDFFYYKIHLYFNRQRRKANRIEIERAR